MSVEQQATRVASGAKSALKALIQKLGGTVPDSTKIDGYASLVNGLDLQKALLNLQKGEMYVLPAGWMLGDVLHRGFPDPTAADYLMNLGLTSTKPGGYLGASADLNGDSYINSSDALCLMNGKYTATDVMGVWTPTTTTYTSVYDDSLTWLFSYTLDVSGITASSTPAIWVDDPSHTVVDFECAAGQVTFKAKGIPPVPVACYIDAQASTKELLSIGESNAFIANPSHTTLDELKAAIYNGRPCFCMLSTGTGSVSKGYAPYIGTIVDSEDKQHSYYAFARVIPSNNDGGELKLQFATCDEDTGGWDTYTRAPTYPEQTDIFWATYGTTTYDEVTAALNAGKVVKVLQDAIQYTYVRKLATSYFFDASMGRGHNTIMLQQTNSTWSLYDQSTAIVEPGSATGGQLLRFNGDTANWEPATLAPADIGAAAADHTHDYLPLSGGTLTGNLTGKYITGTWLQTTAATDKTGNFATIDGEGWVYYRTPAEARSDIGAAATSHQHSASDITLGTISIARGGTGAANASSALSNLGAVPKSGGTMTGPLVAQTNTSYTTAQMRNVIISTADPSGGNNGDIWLKYEA